MSLNRNTISSNSSRANSAFLIGFFTILGAWGFELIGGYQPCELCQIQRLPYYIGLPILLIIIALWDKIAIFLRIALTIIVALLFAWGAYMGAFHAGFEWGFWSGPTSCASSEIGINFGELSRLNEVQVIPCDEPQFRMFGLSFAGYNAIISSIIFFILLWSAKGQYDRMKNSYVKKSSS